MGKKAVGKRATGKKAVGKMEWREGVQRGQAVCNALSRSLSRVSGADKTALRWQCG